MQWERCPRIFLYFTPGYVVNSARTSNVYTGLFTLLYQIHIEK